MQVIFVIGRVCQQCIYETNEYKYVNKTQAHSSTLDSLVNKYIQHNWEHIARLNFGKMYFITTRGIFLFIVLVASMESFFLFRIG
jgi:hypothetical protein